MTNTILTTAIADFHAAEAAIPHEAEDDVMDAAVALSFDALDRVCRIPCSTEEDVDVKLELASGLVEWDNVKERLIEKAYFELLTIQANRNAQLRHAT